MPVWHYSFCRCQYVLCLKSGIIYSDQTRMKASVVWYLKQTFTIRKYFIGCQAHRTDKWKRFKFKKKCFKFTRKCELANLFTIRSSFDTPDWLILCPLYFGTWFVIISGIKNCLVQIIYRFSRKRFPEQWTDSLHTCITYVKAYFRDLGMFFWSRILNSPIIKSKKMTENAPKH